MFASLLAVLKAIGIAVKTVVIAVTKTALAITKVAKVTASFIGGIAVKLGAPAIVGKAIEKTILVGSAVAAHTGIDYAVRRLPEPIRVPISIAANSAITAGLLI